MQRLFLLVLVVGGASFSGWWLGEQSSTSTQKWRVTAVIDGDTIEVVRRSQNDIVRLLGVDTPETHHPTKPVGCFGPEASAFSTHYLLGQLVDLEDDVEHRDIYGRRLAYVFLGGRLFNDVLLRHGLARLLVIAPNRAHGRDFLDSELLARHQKRGLWAKCGDE